jgi:hypothetical protein
MSKMKLNLTITRKKNPTIIFLLTTNLWWWIQSHPMVLGIQRIAELRTSGFQKMLQHRRPHIKARTRHKMRVRRPTIDGGSLPRYFECLKLFFLVTKSPLQRRQSRYHGYYYLLAPRFHQRPYYLRQSWRKIVTTKPERIMASTWC